jgi:hypothetical protein
MEYTIASFDESLAKKLLVYKVNALKYLKNTQ